MSASNQPRNIECCFIQKDQRRKWRRVVLMYENTNHQNSVQVAELSRVMSQLIEENTSKAIRKLEAPIGDSRMEPAALGLKYYYEDREGTMIKVADIFSNNVTILKAMVLGFFKYSRQNFYEIGYLERRKILSKTVVQGNRDYIKPFRLVTPNTAVKYAERIVRCLQYLLTIRSLNQPRYRNAACWRR